MDTDFVKSFQKDGFFYVATPYSKYPQGLEQAYKDASKAAAWLLKQGITVFCPIAHTHPIAIYGNIDPVDYNIWIPMHQTFMKLAKGLIVVDMPSWEVSKGVQIEIAEFIKQGKPVFHLDWPIPE